MDSFLIPTLIVTLLIVVNGLFVAAEFAIAGISRPAIEARARSGDRTAAIIAALLSEPRRQDQYIATAQLGITFATLGLGMYGEHQLAQGLYRYFDGSGWAAWAASHTVASIVAIAIITYFHIVIGEMVPKALALQQPERAAVIVTPPMLWFRRAGLPLVLALNGTGNLILRMFGVRRVVGEEQVYTPEELQLIIRESADKGELAQSSAQLLVELFDFGHLDAGAVMVPRVNVRGIELDASRDEALDALRESDHTRYPVYAGDLDHIVGMIHTKDFLRVTEGTGEGFVRERLRPVPYVPETSSMSTVLDVMRRERVQLVVVLDEHGGTAGIVTVEDLAEEVVTPIEERTHRKPELYLDEQGALRVSGTTRVEKVGEELGFELGHPEVETVSGLVLMLLDRAPQVGDAVVYHDTHFRVTSVAGRGVAECVVSREEVTGDEE